MTPANSHNGHGPQPLIGFPCARDKSQRYYGLPIFIQNQTYLRAVTDAGGAPIIIPLQLDESTLRVIFDTLDAVFLPGGEDMDPSLYGEDQHEMLGAIDPERDRTELLLARWALAERKPLLAICRGMQLLNVATGGSLYQDIRAQRDESLKHDYFPPQFERTRISHEVLVQADSKLGRIFSQQVPVNSMHHQGLKTLGRDCRITAWAPDGVPEALEVDGHPFAVGVQWHPEELATHHQDPESHGLFAAFVEQAQQFAAAKTLRHAQAGGAAASYPK